MNALPVSFEYPAVPAIQYPIQCPPLVPDVQLLPDAQPILVLASALVANEAGHDAYKSQPRMFCYNLLCSNGWNNPQFASVVKMVCDACVLKARNSRNSVESYLRETVGEVLALYTSVLVMSYPDLQRMLPPDSLANAANNQNVYYGLEQAIAQMYGSRSNFVSVSQTGPVATTMNRGIIPPAGAHPVASNMIRGQQAQTTPMKAAFPSPGAFAQKSSTPPNAVARIGNFPTPPAPQQAKEPEVPSTPAPATPVLTGEIEKMDRQAHAIAYFGKEYPVSTAPLRRSMEVAVEQFEEAAGAQSDAQSPVINDVWLIEPSLDQLLVDIKARSMEANPNFELRVDLSIGLVAQPILSHVPLGALFDQLGKSATFADVSLVITNWLQEQAPINLRSALNVAAQLDKILVEMLNNFLAGLVFPKLLQVTSFIEDAPDLAKYLTSEYGVSYHQVYQRFQTKVLQHLFKHTRAINDDVFQSQSELDEYQVVQYDVLTLSYGVAYIAASAQDLGYNISRSGTIVNSNSPMFDRLLKALNEVQKKRFTPAQLLIVTSDDHHYLVNEQGATQGSYALMEV